MNDSPALTASGARPLLESGRPLDDSRAFRRCLGHYPTGVAVVTAREGATNVGMAVNSFAAVSLDPPLILWSIRKASASLPAFLRATHFAVNILAAEQAETSRLFGAGHPDRFELTPWHLGESGSPLLDGAIGHLECCKTVAYEGGDHLILLGHVERFARYEGEPLVFAQGQYAVSQAHPQVPSAPAERRSTDTEGASAGPDANVTFLKLLSQAQHRLSALFDAHRQELGVTAASTRVFSQLREGPCDFEALERGTFIGREALEDTLVDLVSAGHVLRHADGQISLTDGGHQKQAAVATRIARFTEEQLRGIDPANIKAAEQVLKTLLRG